MEQHFLMVCFVILVSLLLTHYVDKPVWTICETEKCPYCYGTDFCESIQMNNVMLGYETVREIFSNYLSVKNVYNGYYKNETVMLKHLGHNWELKKLDDTICGQNNLGKECFLGDIIDVQNYEEKIMTFLDKRPTTQVEHFKSCNAETSRLFLDRLMEKNHFVVRDIYLKNVWTTLQMNVEPLMLQLLNKNFPVPHLYGACGRLIVVKNAGENLNSISDHDWIQRAYVALQIVKAAKGFTEEHKDFRFYLTDISPDNIAVDKNLKVKFVDLENVILISKTSKGIAGVHHSEELSDEYSYEQNLICKHSVSDHNFLAVCNLLLSSNAPYPMMKRGLLHSPPSFIRNKYNYLYDLIKVCETPTKEMSRFQASEKIASTLEHILTEHQFEL